MQSIVIIYITYNKIRIIIYLITEIVVFTR